MNSKSRIFDTLQNSRIHHEDPKADAKLAAGLVLNLPLSASRPIVVVCIGTDRSTGDSLGPLVGTFLEEMRSPSFHIYGTLDDPIHAVNLEDKLKEISKKHFHPFIIAIDACLGRFKSVGIIQVCDGPVKPGAGVNKELPEVGDMHITGIVNVSGFMEFFVLQNTRLSLVVKMAKMIANGIHLASKYQSSQIGWSELRWNREQETVNEQTN
ncbi:spore protease YyaC [Neobacillus notoginsengisoli]|uniref:Spore protease YyaC n=1 Tax=Neobacillus notoginsengisoli TaxID=1578198 RepID=A0A417YTP7_9BACI|nr:spore protease YyaC [Neobacillus notoginsengisoli]RHW40421.1 spore protease YyaC [Neobacillus notoginsengisoli]